MILSAAEHVFARHGFSGSRLKEIAEEAGLPKANILYYFKSKEDLYRYVCQEILENWLGAIGEISESSEPDEAVRKYIEAKMELSIQRPNASRVFAMEIISGAPVIGDYLAGISQLVTPTGVTMTVSSGIMSVNAWAVVDAGTEPTWAVVDIAA